MTTEPRPTVSHLPVNPEPGQRYPMPDVDGIGPECWITDTGRIRVRVDALYTIGQAVQAAQVIMILAGYLQHYQLEGKLPVPETAQTLGDGL